jgi:DNA-binding NtrC family response regulator
LARILCIDDEQIIQWGLCVLLKDFGHEAVAVGSLPEAKALLASDNFDLVICDGKLERQGDGADFAEQLAKEGRKVIICSGHADNQRNGVRFFYKLGKEKLSDVITEILGN